MAELDLSVIVPCYGRPDLTRRLLGSLVECADQFEVVLVDDASPEPVSKIAASYGDRLNLRVIRHADNKGPAAARNTGLRAATHDIVAFTDNDCIVDSAWAGLLAVYLRDAHDKIAGVGGRVLAVGEDVYSQYFTYHKILDPFQSHGRYLYVVTANCAFRRQSLEAVGGFDERIRHPGGEDPGLCFKLLQAGWQLDYWKEAVVYHHYRMGIRDFVRTFFRYGRGCRKQTDAFGVGLGEDQKLSLGFGGSSTFLDRLD